MIDLDELGRDPSVHALLQRSEVGGALELLDRVAGKLRETR